jgi:hypothetical protein
MTAGIFLGYDPGGRDCNGVAVVQVTRNGSIERLKTAIVRDASEALEWLSQFEDAAYLGIDTLLAWSRTGGRDCDDRLRKRYKGRGGRSSVIPQNTLYSAMTLNGVIVAMGMREAKESLVLCESHPKLQVSANLLPSDVIKLHATLVAENGNDHCSDALIAAWCASRWHCRAWTFDLYMGEGNLVFPAGHAVFPWPEAV